MYKQLDCGICCSITVASYPGLLTLAFVASSTNAREGLVKLITCNDAPGCWVDMWRSGRFLLYSYEVAFWTQETSPRLPGVKHSVAPWSVFTINSALTVILGMWRSSTRPSNVQVVIACDQFYQAFHSVSTASDKHWSEKAWVWSYSHATTHNTTVKFLVHWTWKQL